MILRRRRGPHGVVLAFLIPAFSEMASSQQTDRASLTVSVRTDQDAPAAGAAVTIGASSIAAHSKKTDDKGQTLFEGLAPGEYPLDVSSPGYGSLSTRVILAPGTSNRVDALLTSTSSRTDAITVSDSVPSEVEQRASVPVTLRREDVKYLPDRPGSVADALPLAPDIIRLPNGQLRILGSGEHRSTLLVNSADATDPGTGQFGATIPIDSVRAMNILSSPFLAEYGGFTADVVSVETRKAGEKWSFELNDPLPEFRFRSWHMRGLRSSTPRANFGGPIVHDRLYLMESLQYEMRATPIVTLPFPRNEERREGYNSFTELDYILNSTNVLTATVHAQHDHTRFANMDLFNPEPVSPNTAGSTYSVALTDRTALGGTLLESGLSASSFHSALWPQGQLPMTLTPTGNSGSYFNQQGRMASRFEWRETWSITRSGWGPHNLKFGSNLAEAVEHASVAENSVNIADTAGTLLETISFTAGSPIHRSDFDSAIFAEDHWTLGSRFAIESGVRAEQQAISHSVRIAPREGFAWTPLANGRTVIRGGVGVFYDRVPLNVYGFTSYPQQVSTYYGPNGAPLGPPVIFYNLTEAAVGSELPFIHARQEPGNFSPYSLNWNFQVEHTVGNWLRIRANYLNSFSEGLITINPRTVQGLSAFVLDGNGGSRLRQFELTSALRISKEREIHLSYVHESARGNLNDFSNYLSGFPGPIILPDRYTNLPGDVAHRMLAWGTLRFPWKIGLIPKVEYRSGLPYSSFDPMQNYFGAPNGMRYPGFLSVDARISKDLKINDKYSLRLSIAGSDLTNHFNPISLHSNTGDPLFNTFVGGYRRRFTADFDVLF